MTLPDLKVSWDGNAMSPFTVIRHVPWKSFFSDVADDEYSQLVEIAVERSIFECKIQKSVPRLLQLRNMLFARIEMSS